MRSAETDGYASIGDAFSGYEHFVHWGWAADETILDPQRPESLMYEVGADGTRRLVSAMYLLPPGATMADVPDLGDERAVWHDHDNLCWTPDRRLAGVLLDGECFPGGEHVVSPPMLHVWIVEHPCGPFAGIEGHGNACAHAHHAGSGGGGRGASG
ncbi:MAG TPA: hypothetical protein VM324_13125 [Egibacteraceae bacterium]|nr:hypothetical protein [Egibacteraceae bacterium]